VLALGALLGLLLGAVGTVLVWAVLPGPGDGRPLAIEWPPGLGPRATGQRLAEAGLVRSPWLMAAYLSIVGESVELRPGPHLLADGLSPRELVQRLARLPTRPKVHVPIPEGFTHHRIAERLEAQGVCTAESFRSAVHDRALLDRLSVSAPSAEGYLFPATYDFPVDSDPTTLVTAFVRETRKRLARLSQKHAGALERLAQSLGFGELEVLIMASIVEKETGHPDERPTIASVFLNRLTDVAFLPRRMLQSDPTAAYGCLLHSASIPSCAGYAGRVTPEMLRDAQNPYNTYKNAGLPPGPIANPGEASIAAVLAPARTDYLYFVAKGGGRHAFSRTFSEHGEAIRRRREQLQQEMLSPVPNKR
jgi:UPF0755 protein